MNFILTAKSPIKVNVVKDAINNHFRGSILALTVDTGSAVIPPQPINESILTCACKRILFAEDKFKDQFPENYVIVSIESGIELSDINKHVDVCCVVLTTLDGFQTSNVSYPISVPKEYYDEAVSKTSKDYPLKHLGLEITIGEIICQHYPDIDPKDWMSDSKFNGHDGARNNQIMFALNECFMDYKMHLLKKDILHFNNLCDARDK